MTDMESRSLKKYATLLAVVFAGMNLGFAAIAGARAGRTEAQSEMRRTAADVVREQWLTTLSEETKKIAAEAAREATDRAMREAVVPLAISIAAHRSMDDERNSEQNRRLDRLENGKPRKKE